MHNQLRKSIPKSGTFNTFNINNVNNVNNLKNTKTNVILSPPKNNDPNIIEEKISGPKNESKTRQYIKGRFLGKGGFAKCYELICKDNNKIFAAKMISKSSIKTERQRQKLITEIKIHKSCHHPNVVAFEHNFEDSENVYILLELCQNQTLSELQVRRKILTEIEVQCYIIQLVKALQYLHSHRIIHRDLKLGTLFLNDRMELKVGDFGLATKLDYDGDRKKTICGTPNYIAPEVISSSGHSYEVDVWAIGIIIYTLLVGKPPFETRDVKTTYGKIKRAEFAFPESSKISSSAKNLIRKILVVDAKSRPSLNDILFDDFFNQGIAIPKLMPTSTLAFRPPIEYVNKYMPKKKNTITIDNNNESNTDNNKINSSNEKTKDTEANDKSNNSTGMIPPFINSTFLSKKEVWVTKWADYSHKYGLGYKLNNGFIGVYFNDNTKMLSNPLKKRITYVERKISDKQELLLTFSMNQYPDDIANKVFLFNQFKDFLEEETTRSRTKTIASNRNKSQGNAEKERTKRRKTRQEKYLTNTKNKTLSSVGDTPTPETDDNSNEYNINGIEESDFIFVKKWLKTKHAIFFRFSNKIIQGIFKDDTQIIIHTLNHKITYINKNGEKSDYPLSKAMNSSNHEMNKRVKYTKEVLAHMICINKKKLEQNNTTPTETTTTNK